MARLYSTKVSSRRWPLQLFYNVLDLAGINALVVYREVTGSKITRRKFLLQLVEEMQMKNSAKEPEASRSDFDGDEEPPSSDKVKRQWCKVNCTRQKPKMTTKTCSKCKRFVCSSCTAKYKNRSCLQKMLKCIV